MALSRTYMVVLVPEEEGGFSVLVPALPEVHTQGESIEEAVERAKLAIELAIEVRRDLGEDIPRDDMPTIESVSIVVDAA